LFVRNIIIDAILYVCPTNSLVLTTSTGLGLPGAGGERYEAIDVVLVPVTWIKPVRAELLKCRHHGAMCLKQNLPRLFSLKSNKPADLRTTGHVIGTHIYVKYIQSIIE